MIDKMSGKVSYAVLSFGGFLGIGDDHYPLPLAVVGIDTGLGGYPHRPLPKSSSGAPKYGRRQRPKLGRSCASPLGE